jgi:uncharacterized protein involved in response to NO
MLLAAAWCVERIGMSFGGGWPRPLFLLSNHLFLGSRRGDADVDADPPPQPGQLPRQRLLPGPAAAVPVAKILLLDGHWNSQAGYGMAIGAVPPGLPGHARTDADRVS